MPLLPGPALLTTPTLFSAYPADILALIPAQYWEAQDASGNAADASGNGNTGVVSGTPAVYRQSGPGIGATPYAIQFGAGDTFFTGGTPNPTINFFIEHWIYATGLVASQLWSSAASGNNITLETDSSNVLTATVQGIADLSHFANVLIPNNWHQIVVGRASNGHWRYWFDGQLDTVDAGSAAPTGTGSFFVSGQAGWKWAHTSVVGGFPTNGQVWKRYMDMLYGP